MSGGAAYVASLLLRDRVAVAGTRTGAATGAHTSIAPNSASVNRPPARRLVDEGHDVTIHVHAQPDPLVERTATLRVAKSSISDFNAFFVDATDHGLSFDGPQRRRGRILRAGLKPVPTCLFRPLGKCHASVTPSARSAIAGARALGAEMFVPRAGPSQP